MGEDDPTATVFDANMITGFLSPAKWALEEQGNSLFRDASLQLLPDPYIEEAATGEISPKQPTIGNNKFVAKHYKNRLPYDTRVI
jgi:hypothetical protein